MMDVASTPQQIEVAAPLDVIFALISSVDHGYRPDARYTLQLLHREGERLVVSVIPSVQANQPPTLKEVLTYPPDRIRYRHLNGPLVGAIEEVHLRSITDGTLVILRGEFPVEEGVGYLVRKMHLEHQAREYLQEVKAAAEQRAGPRLAPGTALHRHDFLPELTDEQALRQAVQAQEEEEFGHAGHGSGVARVAMGLASQIGLSGRQIEQLRRAALLHDVGKVAVDPALWANRGTLTSRQRRQMEAHVRLGYELAKRAALTEEEEAAILHHHERWDGQGYPKHLAGENIPLGARLLFVAEVIDSMLRTSYRRQPMVPAQVADVLEAGVGRQWDPQLARQAARMMRGQS